VTAAQQYYRVEGRNDYALHADRECPSIQGRSVRPVDRTSYPDADLCERCADRESERADDDGRVELAVRLKDAEGFEDLRDVGREVA